MTDPFPRSLRSLALALALVAADCAADAVEPDAWAAPRAEFRAAYAAAATDADGTGDSATLRAYPLYPYLEAARLRAAWADPRRRGDPDLETRSAGLLQRLGEQPLGRSLRRDWLLHLADVADWPRFDRAYRPAEASAELRCDALQARIALGRTERLAPEITREWLTGSDAPEACNAPFDWLRAQQALPPSLVEQRARLALKAGNARLGRVLAGPLPPGLAAPLKQWATLIEAPRTEIDALIAAPARPVEPAALIDGWTRLSRRDPDAALARLPGLLEARRLTADADAAPFVRALGLSLAWSRRPEAAGLLARVPPASADDLVQEWRVRARLWSGDWAGATADLAGMAPALREQPRWRYWQARAQSKAGNEAAARAAYAALASESGYYPALAAARLQQPYAPQPQPTAFDPATQARLSQIAGLVRARELWLCAMEPQAGAEWQAVFETLDAGTRTQAVGVAAAWGWYDQAVASASKQGIFNDYALLYPRPYNALVAAAAARNGVAEDLVYAVIRQETLYNPNAVSPAGALGLMQLTLPTARGIARRGGQPAPSREALFDPAVNVPLGTAELRERLDRFDGQVPLALAGYNAGPGAAARWRPPQALDADIWIENVPYNETRTYIQRVLWHSLIFAWRADGKPQPVAAWLGRIAGTQAQDEDEPADAPDTPVAAPPAAASVAPPANGDSP